MTHHRTLPLLLAAQSAAERGWHVFPLVPGDKRPAVRAWEERATTDTERIARCWATGAYNIGVATGPSGLVVVDLDTPKGEDDTPPADLAAEGVTCGEDTLALLAQQHGQPYPCQTFTVRTGRGGTHLYFTAPAGTELRNTAGKLGWKVDTRAHGGYVVGPGSVAAGKPYTVVHDAPPAPLPSWLADLLRPAPLPPQRPVTVPLTTTGRRGRYLRAALKAELERVTSSPPDGHNNALYLASVALGQLVAGGELGETEVADQLTAAALHVGQSEREARRTIASGLRAGAQRPRTVAA
ncbi:bifunctional DNA primase/polymerase [Streptomyces sp. S1A]|uniref:bifunctional DNA primase/polymerase n=1 Tax=Streptomyces sp. ICN903 TaxID=2964654 RepID=UPI001EDAFF7B|nr:bifunctional DNA primase/polymerase [Streptomyces sp. ICN903]MCG3041935.1 bifunctional DNA primase/polymerase [Streptomyces sp. ICN903]